ncbi:MAG: DUF4190 domain-containing protein [Actinobacteria bacterium]|nr:DUF4190 domain-containing protein [Actinomycetota bacterium]
MTSPLPPYSDGTSDPGFVSPTTGGAPPDPSAPSDLGYAPLNPGGMPPPYPGGMPPPYPGGMPPPYPGGMPPPYGVGGYGYPPGYPPLANRSNGMAIAALVLGIVSIFMSFTIWVGAITGIVGLILGIVGISQSKRNQAGGRGMAIAGVVTSVIGLVLAVALTIILVNVFSECADSDPICGPLVPSMSPAPSVVP